MSYPLERPRRLRSTPSLRSLARETDISVNDLVQPLFVVQDLDSRLRGKDKTECPNAPGRSPISSLPGQYHLSPEEAAREAVRLAEIGLPAVILFGLPAFKDAVGSSAWEGDGPVQQAARLIKAAAPCLTVITDLCLCEYTDHGHCGALKGDQVDNDATLELLAKTAVSQAEAGADVIAPSDMMDGRIQAVRRALDQAGYANTAILSYAAKYASAFYGPFREAAVSTPAFGDRKGYQMDPANREEALREVALDLEEGADMVMVKPAMPYLDVIREIKRRFERPTAAYQVSGEWAMLEVAAAAGLIDRRRAIAESLISIRRAGADFVITYGAGEAAQWLREGSFGW
ncbi:MAG: porphobilinogen synthase [Calditrichota bacterium]